MVFRQIYLSLTSILFRRHDEGPIPERDYCQRHLGKVYSLEEVEKMINDMGQPALYYCGGYKAVRQLTDGYKFIYEL
jgi:hypothetical protein